MDLDPCDLLTPAQDKYFGYFYKEEPFKDLQAVAAGESISQTNKQTCLMSEYKCPEISINRNQLAILIEIKLTEEYKCKILSNTLTES